MRKGRIPRIKDTVVRTPKKEQWLWEDPIALELVMRGLEDAKEGRISQIDTEILQDDIEFSPDDIDKLVLLIEDDLIPDF